MKRITRVTLVAFSASFALAAVVLLTIGYSSVLATAAADVAIEIKSPEQVAAGDPFVANISFVNFGLSYANGNVITATIPDGTSFVKSTDGSGDPIVPDFIGSNVILIQRGN